jgi:hypothetical protein
MVAAGRWGREIEDVALGDAEVLEKLPGGVGEIRRNRPSEIGGEILDSFVKGSVSLATMKQLDQLLP